MEQSSPPYLFEVGVVGVLRIWNSMRVPSMLQLAVLDPTTFLAMFSLWRRMGIRGGNELRALSLYCYICNVFFKFVNNTGTVVAQSYL